MNIARLDLQACETGLVPQANHSYQNTCRKYEDLHLQIGRKKVGKKWKFNLKKNPTKIYNSKTQTLSSSGLQHIKLNSVFQYQRTF